MPKRKETEKFAAVGSKDCWHSYGLQTLAPAKFAMVVGKILSGNYMLITQRSDQRLSV
jgi:hypothetical protein